MVGVVGVSLDTYHAFSLLELLLKIDGYHLRLELENYLPARNILTMIHNANSRHGKSPATLWPLSLDEIDRQARIKWMDKHVDKEMLRAWALEQNNLA